MKKINYTVPKKKKDFDLEIKTILNFGELILSNKNYINNVKIKPYKFTFDELIKHLVNLLRESNQPEILKNWDLKEHQKTKPSVVLFFRNL